MASSCLFIIVLISLAPIFLQPGLAQGPSPPASCASLLFALAPCGPFVQGFVQFPAQPCCNSLNQIYSQQPTCLCLFLNNNSTLSSAFPINQTLALQLPQLCSIPANSSVCSSGMYILQELDFEIDQSSEIYKSIFLVERGFFCPSTISSTISSTIYKRNWFSKLADFSLSATPVAQVAPKPTNMMGLGLGYGLRSSGTKPKIQLTIFVVAAALTGTLFLV